MRFIYDKNAGAQALNLESQSFHHIFNVRRQSALKSELFSFANLNDGRIYRYKLCEQSKKSALFSLQDFAQVTQDSPKTHIFQAVISDFDKILPFLNELFVEKITLFYADFSQKNLRVNLPRLDSIIVHSCEQCGRLDKMEVEVLDSLDCALQQYSDLVALDFCDGREDLGHLNRFVIGPEGGFSPRERELFQTSGKVRAVGLNHPLILRAQTASIFVAGIKTANFSRH